MNRKVSRTEVYNAVAIGRAVVVVDTVNQQCISIVNVHNVAVCVRARHFVLETRRGMIRNK